MVVAMAKFQMGLNSVVKFVYLKLQKVLILIKKDA